MAIPPNVSASEVNKAFDELICSLSFFAPESTSTVSPTSTVSNGRDWKPLKSTAPPLSEVRKIFSENMKKADELGNNRPLRDKLITLYNEVRRIYKYSEDKWKLLDLVETTLTQHFATLMLEDIEKRLPPEFELKRDNQGNFVEPVAQLESLRTIFKQNYATYVNFGLRELRGRFTTLFDSVPIVSPEDYVNKAQELHDWDFHFNLSYALPPSQKNWENSQAIAKSLNENGGLVPLKAIIPREISQLKELESLAFQQSLITFLPSYLENLTNLKTLDLRNTMIDKPQEVIYHLPALRVLAARFFYPDLSRLPQLTVLDLSKVFDPMPFPLDLSNNKNLERLGLHHCQLKILPPGLSTLNSLKVLYLDNNQLEDIQEIQYLPLLEELDIQNNSGIIEIPIGNLRNLKKITCDLSHLSLITFSPKEAENLQLERILCPNANGGLVIAWQKSPEGPSLTDFLKSHRVTPKGLP